MQYLSSGGCLATCLHPRRSESPFSVLLVIKSLSWMLLVFGFDTVQSLSLLSGVVLNPSLEANCGPWGGTEEGTVMNCGRVHVFQSFGFINKQ